jgi:ring-1,2-phenylacetyl-CoA epoxidase subunit PaaD
VSTPVTHPPARDCASPTGDLAEDVAGDAAELRRWREVAGSVPDPEIPVLTLHDLGILRDVQVSGDGTVEVTLTPTYTGCPATAVIAADVETALRAAGVELLAVRTVLAPAWTTDWMSEQGRRKLREYGIAPPGGRRPTCSGRGIGLTLSARCPRCGSTTTREISRFGSTPCKSLWSCLSCAEPFDSFKAI